MHMHALCHWNESHLTDPAVRLWRDVPRDDAARILPPDDAAGTRVTRARAECAVWAVLSSFRRWRRDGAPRLADLARHWTHDMGFPGPLSAEQVDAWCREYGLLDHVGNPHVSEEDYRDIVLAHARDLEGYTGYGDTLEGSFEDTVAH